MKNQLFPQIPLELQEAFENDEWALKRYNAVKLMYNDEIKSYYDEEIKRIGICNSSIKVYYKKYIETNDIRCFLSKKRNTGKLYIQDIDILYEQIENEIPEEYRAAFKKDGLAIRRFAGFMLVRDGLFLKAAAKKVNISFSVISKYKNEYLKTKDINCFLTKK